MYKGIFWCYRKEFVLGNEVMSSVIVTPIKVKCDIDGNALEEVAYSSKSGNNFNHESEWRKLDTKFTKGRPFNFFPRGRIEINAGKIKLFANPTILADEGMMEAVLRSFELSDQKVTLIADNSYHYKYLGDESEWGD